jgi:HEPN domain-containing protein
MSKQTAVEYLIEVLRVNAGIKVSKQLQEEVLKMEKEQIENTWIDATPRNIPKYEEITKEYAKQYYNETYKKAQ